MWYIVGCSVDFAALLILMLFVEVLWFRLFFLFYSLRMLVCVRLFVYGCRLVFMCFVLVDTLFSCLLICLLLVLICFLGWCFLGVCLFSGWLDWWWSLVVRLLVLFMDVNFGLICLFCACWRVVLRVLYLFLGCLCAYGVWCLVLWFNLRVWVVVWYVTVVYLGLLVVFVCRLDVVCFKCLFDFVLGSVLECLWKLIVFGFDGWVSFGYWFCVLCSC